MRWEHIQAYLKKYKLEIFVKCKMHVVGNDAVLRATSLLAFGYLVLPSWNKVSNWLSN